MLCELNNVNMSFHAPSHTACKLAFEEELQVTTILDCSLATIAIFAYL